MLKKMEQMKKKAEAVVSTVDISEREKMAQLRRIYKKAGLAKEKHQVTYLVAKKGVRPQVRRPPGIKGQFKVVDSRLKKDTRAQKCRRTVIEEVWQKYTLLKKYTASSPR